MSDSSHATARRTVALRKWIPWIYRLTVSAAAVALILVTPAVAVAEPHVAPFKAAPQTLDGTGDAVPSVKPIKEPVIITLSHDGAANFIVQPVGADGDEGGLWANKIGVWAGTTYQEMDTFLSDFGKKNPIVALTITADGVWNIQIKPLSAAPRKPLKSGQGTGEVVIRLSRPVTKLTRISFTHDGQANFIVQPIDASGDAGLLVNEIGPYKGTKLLPKGTQYLWITADGNWSYVTK